MPNRRASWIPALLLILLGAWLLAYNLNVPLPDFAQLWPALPLFFGLAFIVQFFAGGRRDEGLMFVGTAATLSGVFFFAFTLNYLHWDDMGLYWPVFVLIGSAAFFAQWLVRPGERGVLVPAFLALIVGGVALPFTLGQLSPDLVALAKKLWPVAIILLGVVLLISYFFRGRPKA